VNEVLGVVDDGYGGVVVVMTMMRLGCEGGRRGRWERLLWDGMMPKWH
jgi:hypothetical protein